VGTGQPPGKRASLSLKRVRTQNRFPLLLAALLFSRPLSAQARTPSRPSGDAKEQEPAENEGGARTRAGAGFRPPDLRVNLVARRHVSLVLTGNGLVRKVRGSG